MAQKTGKSRMGSGLARFRILKDVVCFSLSLHLSLDWPHFFLLMNRLPSHVQRSFLRILRMDAERERKILVAQVIANLCCSRVGAACAFLLGDSSFTI